MKKNDQVQEVEELIREGNHLVVLTGAGMSTASGIPDFRSDNGIYETTENPERYLSRYYYNGYPKDFWVHYKEIFSLKLMGNYQPNAGHYALATLNENHKVTVLTQNVDGLHQQAGSRQVFEMHGSIQMATCPKCKTRYDLNYINKEAFPRCSKTNGKGRVCQFILKPDVVLFGDDVRHYKEAEEAIRQADIFIVLGSSLLVKPVSELPSLAKRMGVKSILVNRESSPKDTLFDYVFHEEIDTFFSKLNI